MYMRLFLTMIVALRNEKGSYNPTFAVSANE